MLYAITIFIKETLKVCLIKIEIAIRDNNFTNDKY